MSTNLGISSMSIETNLLVSLWDEVRDFGSGLGSGAFGGSGSGDEWSGDHEPVVNPVRPTPLRPVPDLVPIVSLFYRFYIFYCFPV